MIDSNCLDMGIIELPQMTAELPMIPFNLSNLDGLKDEFKSIACEMINHLRIREGIAFLTVHGRYVDKSDTLRRGGAHIDGNYMNYIPGKDFKSFGGGDNGFKLGENGPIETDPKHINSYENERGGIIMASTYSSCKGYKGRFSGSPKRGGDCTHIQLNKGFTLKPNRVYYGNNRFIHESLPIDKSTHRTLYRITLPITHEFEGI